MDSTEEPSAKGHATYRKEDIMAQWEPLDHLFEPSRVRLPGLWRDWVGATRELGNRLSDWVRKKGALLWLEGMPPAETPDAPSRATLMAANIVNMAYGANVPVMSYFCHGGSGERRRPDSTGSPPRGSNTEACIAVIASLVRQAMTMLPPTFTTSDDLSETRLRAVEKYAVPPTQALILLGDVLKVLAVTRKIPPLICIIDGVHWLRGAGGEDDFLGLLLQFLRDAGVKVMLVGKGTAASALVQRSEVLQIPQYRVQGEFKLTSEMLRLRDIDTR